MNQEARKEYEAAVAEFKEFCLAEANLNVEIQTDCYPMMICLTPAAVQQSMFLTEEANLGANSTIMIRLGIQPIMTSNRFFKMDVEILKKITKKATKIGGLYLQAFRERAAEMLAEYTEDGMAGVEILKKLCNLE